MEELLVGAIHDYHSMHYLYDDEVVRLRLWIANIGAHQRDSPSLEFRLRDASHIRNQIVELLKSLQTMIDEAEALSKTV